MVHDMLLAALIEHFGSNRVSVRRASERPWASATFSGARHMFELAVEAQGDSALISARAGSLHDDQFEMPGHIVADLVCRCEGNGDQQAIIVEALTVEAV